MPNVFISHRATDSAQAKRLAEEVRKAGHMVWLDEWRIGIGDSIVERINEGLEDATHVILCYSSSGINSPWMSREWFSATARQLNGRGIKVLPVLLTGGSPPPILADIKYADLKKDWSTGLVELLRAIR